MRKKEEMSFKCKAKIIKCPYQKEEFRIFNCSPVGKPPQEITLSSYFTFSIKGQLAYLDVGKEYTFELEVISESAQFGTTCKVISVPSLTALDLDSLTPNKSKEILSEITTTSQADNILKVYPDFIKKVMTEGKEGIDVKKIYNVGAYRLNAYIRLLTNKYKYLNMLTKLKDYQVDIIDCKSLYDTYHNDNDILEAFDKTPYRVLINCLHKGFNRADNLLMKVRPELEASEQRCEFIVLDILDRNENDGSSKLAAKTLFDVAKTDYNVPQLLPLLKNVSQESDLIYYNEDTNELSKMNTYSGECLIADFVKEKLRTSKDNVWDIDWTKYTKVGDFQLTDTQALALKNVCESQISIIAGYSGAGKTSSVKGIVALLEDNHKSYTLLSTTGKASRVLAESTGRSASTIHRKCLKGTVDTDFILCDETSMCAIDVMCMLINAITNPDVHIVFVGDPAQLTSVGVGKVFTNMIESKIIPMITLTDIFRYKSDGSLFVATNIRQGKSFLNNTDMVKQNGDVYTVGNNYKFINTTDIFNTAISEYMKLINKGVKPLDILGLSPMNKGELGTRALNNAIQLEINPPKPNEKVLTRKIDNEEITFRTGDCVINTKNDYNAVSEEAYWEMKSDSLLSEQDVADTMVMNGQSGIIRQVLDDGLIIQFDEEMLYFNKGKIYNLLLNSFISVHKSQGSTVKYSIEIISDKHSKMLTRNLLYVGATRNQVSHIEIGDIDTFNKALSIEDNDNRKTWLKDLLVEKD